METVFFTDIEGSARLWEEQGEAMGQALARHDRILIESVAGCNGRVLKTTGDGVVAVFSNAWEGVEAAIRAQRSLASETWETTGPIRVRIGIHAGETEHRDGDLFGPTMNRASRIMAAGHGGQILLSEVTVGIAQPRLPDGAALLDLGIHRLKDLTVPEHLFQLVCEGLPNEFPALRTLDARPNNLPEQTSEFLGRSGELAAIQAILGSPGTRLLTITGPGGAGKTRLALQVAAEQLDHCPDGVFFVDLTSETTAEGAYEAIVHTLQLPATGGGDALNVLVTRLRDRQMLLLLDNFEQVTSAAVGLVQILQVAPGIKLLVTSRETLRVRAEKVYPVPPLGLPHPRSSVAEIVDAESVRLFSDRARAATPDFRVDEENAAILAEIVLRLDGLPLAIELAAARLNVFTPSELLERIRDRLDVLGSGGRDLPDRQRTLWGAIGWSYELLDPVERELFELMSVFSSATLSGLESVSATRDVVDTVASLVDKSLVRIDDSGSTRRFSMLQMIKEYAAERLALFPDRRDQVRSSHAHYFSSRAVLLADQVRGSDREQALIDADLESGDLNTAWRYRVEQEDARQVLDLVDDLWVVFEAKGWYRSAIDIAQEAIALLGDGYPAEELTLRTVRARALMAVRGYTEDVEMEFHKALTLADTVPGRAEKLPVLRALATYYMGISDFASGVEFGERILELAEETADIAVLVEGHYVLGAALAFTGNPVEGLVHLDRAIELHDPKAHHFSRYRLGPNTGVTARVASGLILWGTGRLDQAVSRVSDALVVAEHMDHPYSLAYALYHNAYLSLLRERFDDTLDLSSRLTRVAEENDYVVWQTLATMLEGVATTMLGDVETGLSLTETAVELYQGTTAPPVFWPLILSLRALVNATAGRLEEAVGLIAEAVTLGPDEESQDPELRVIRGDILRLSGNISGAESEYVLAGQLAGQLGQLLVELRALTRLLELRRELANSDEGAEELAVVYQQFEEGFGEQDLVRARRLIDG